MKLQQALMLVRNKIDEEHKDITTSDMAEKYIIAYKEYPALMTVAHFLYARNLEKEAKLITQRTCRI